MDKIHSFHFKSSVTAIMRLQQSDVYLCPGWRFVASVLFHLPQLSKATRSGHGNMRRKFCTRMTKLWKTSTWFDSNCSGLIFSWTFVCFFWLWIWSSNFLKHSHIRDPWGCSSGPLFWFPVLFSPHLTGPHWAWTGAEPNSTSDQPFSPTSDQATKTSTSGEHWVNLFRDLSAN